jgi:hypothetical protein
MAEGLGMRVRPIAAESESMMSRPGPLFMEAYLYHWFLLGQYLAYRFNDQSSIDQIS